MLRTQMPRGSRTGGALLLALVTLTVLVGLSGAMLMTSAASQREVGSAVERTRALYAAEAGVAHALEQISRGQQPDLGSAGAGVGFGGGDFWGDALKNADGSWTIHSVGRTGRASRALEVVLTPISGGIYDNAVFAGNTSGDASYAMRFGGTGAHADEVKGNIYSGQDAVFSGDARIDGTPRTLGALTAPPGAILPDADGHPRTPVQGQSQPLPDISGMHYATNNDVDVAHEFLSATYKSGTPGGKAWQLPADNPAHIFRKNPSDRTANTSTTEKDDYFLEDPYTTMHTDPRSDGSDPYMVQLSTGANDGNHKLYYVDGNLWVHNLSCFSFEIDSASAGSSGVELTIVVSGNIYISDNIYLKDKERDGLALIALKDPAVHDSGNIYFGDPTFGTLEHMSAFMYAENDFLDTNLNAAGSAAVTLDGNMTAGNQVRINRDYDGAHSKLTVNFDDRISTRQITLPGLPRTTATQSGLRVSLWHEVALP